MIQFSSELVHARSFRRDRLLQEVSCLILNLSITNVKLLYAKKFNLIDLRENMYIPKIEYSLILFTENETG